MTNENLFTNRKILDILDGDALLDSFNGVDYKMPYLSGPAICDIGINLGFEMEYPWQGALSRWCYMRELVLYCCRTNKIPQLLTYLFNKSQFATNNIKNLTQGLITADEYHKKTIQLTLSNINDILSLKNLSIEYVNNSYRLVGTNLENLKIDKLKEINNDYIKGIVDRAHDDIKSGNYDSSITKSRTMLEELFCYIIEQEGLTPSDTGKIDDLYKQVRTILNINNNKNIDSRINGLISGLNSIVNNIASMRNISSDSHGVGSTRFNLQEYHAVLCVNSAMVVAEFLLSCFKAKKTV